MTRTLQEWYRYREMFVALVARDVRGRYRGSLLGILWSFINPMMQMAVYTVVFSYIFRAGVPNYNVFLFCALLPWMWFTSSLTAGANAIVANGNLVKKIYFPTELLPMVAVTSNLINFLLSLPVLFAFLVAYRYPPSWTWLALPLVIVVQFALTSGFSILLASLNTFYRDVSYLLGVLITMWFYVTPIIYPASLVPERLMPLMALNPMFHVVSTYRQILLDGTWPSWQSMSAMLALSMVLLFGSLTIFNRTKFQFAEVV
jgi:ABC-2 type transport system permease protein